jgi:hypothetical protein
MFIEIHYFRAESSALSPLDTPVPMIAAMHRWHAKTRNHSIPNA